MRHIILAAMVLLLAAGASVGFAADSSNSVMEQRLKALEARVVELERRLGEKEAAPAPAPVAPVAPAGAASTAAPAPAPVERAIPARAAVAARPAMPADWSGLRRGMNGSQVTTVLGKPGKKRVGVMSEIWFYPDTDGGSVEFDRDGRVSGWNEP
jgi:hypothetical protein